MRILEKTGVVARQAEDVWYGGGADRIERSRSTEWAVPGRLPVHITILHAVRHGLSEVGNATMFGVPGALMLAAGSVSPDPNSFQYLGWPGVAMFALWGIFARWDKWQRYKRESARQDARLLHDGEFDARAMQSFDEHLNRFDDYARKAIDMRLDEIKAITLGSAKPECIDEKSPQHTKTQHNTGGGL